MHLHDGDAFRVHARVLELPGLHVRQDLLDSLAPQVQKAAVEAPLVEKSVCRWPPR